MCIAKTILHTCIYVHKNNYNTTLPVDVLSLIILRTRTNPLPNQSVQPLHPSLLFRVFKHLELKEASLSQDSKEQKVLTPH